MIIDLDKIDWQFLGTIILPFVAIIVTIWIYYLQKQKKHFSYGIISSKKHSVKVIGKSKVTITEITIRYKNPSKTPLTRQDFVSDVTTKFIRSTIIKAEIPNTFAYNPVEASISFLDDTSILTTNLLNEEDHINVLYLVSNFNNKIHVGGRIVGVRNITNFKIYDMIKQSVFLLFIVYFIWILTTIKETHTFDISSTLEYLLASSLALIVFSLIQIWREIKKQFVLFHSEELI